MSEPIHEASLDTIFCDARSANAWTDEPVSEAQIRAVYDLAKMGPTTGNSCPGRFLFLKKGEARDRLVPLMSEGNRQKTADAPWTVLIAHDLEFFDKIPTLFPSRPEMFDGMKGKDAVIGQHVLRNSSLQGAYLMLAARSLGLDCGPMGGFDADGVNKEFFLSHDIRKNWRINWICNIGHAQPPQFPRLPRLSFEEAAGIL